MPRGVGHQHKDPLQYATSDIAAMRALLPNVGCVWLRGARTVAIGKLRTYSAAHSSRARPPVRRRLPSSPGILVGEGLLHALWAGDVVEVSGRESSWLDSGMNGTQSIDKPWGASVFG